MIRFYHIDSYNITKIHHNSLLYDFNSIIDYNDDGTIERNNIPIHQTDLELTINPNTTVKELKRLYNLPLEQFQPLVIKRDNIPLITDIEDPTTYEGLAVVTAEGEIYLKKFYKTLDFIV